VVESAKNQLLRDFWRRSIFDFCNTIPPKADDSVMLALSDQQLDTVMRAARSIRREDRDRFLCLIAEQLKVKDIDVHDDDMATKRSLTRRVSSGSHIVVQDAPNAAPGYRYYARHRAILPVRALDTLDAIAGAAVVYAYNDCRGSVSTNLHRMAIGASRATKSQCLVDLGRGGRGRDAGSDQSRRYRQHHFMKITHWLTLSVGALCAALIGKGLY
jgi:hypothetical protein